MTAEEEIDAEEESKPRRFSTAHGRFHVGGSVSCLIESYAKFDSARERAIREAARGDEDITIYDAMARRGRPDLWTVAQDGTVAVARTRSA